MSSIAELTERVRATARDRDWEPLRTPKHLSTAPAGEVGKLLAELQWLTPGESLAVMDDEQLGPRVRAELGDVAIYLVRLADCRSPLLYITAVRPFSATWPRGSAMRSPHS